MQTSATQEKVPSRENDDLGSHSEDSCAHLPLHRAAQLGDIVECNRLISEEHDPSLLDPAGRTAAQVAFENGNQLIGHMLSLALEAARAVEISNHLSDPRMDRDFRQMTGFTSRQSTSTFAELEFDFEAEVEPEKFVQYRETDSVSADFQTTSGEQVAFLDDAEWDIEGELPSTFDGRQPSDQVGASDPFRFLETQSRGRTSGRTSVLRTGTHMSVEADDVSEWVVRLQKSGRLSEVLIGDFLALIDGNAEVSDLSENLMRELQPFGIFPCVDDLLCGPQIDLDDPAIRAELVESLVATFSSRLALPGLQASRLDRAKERSLFDRISRSLATVTDAILNSEIASKLVLRMTNSILDGKLNANSLSELEYVPQEPSSEAGRAFMVAKGALEIWECAGRPPGGPLYRQVSIALASLELSPGFLDALVLALAERGAETDSSELSLAIDIRRKSTDELRRLALPLVRRFASRSVLDEEDPEEVFQVAYLGMHRAIDRFDPSSNNRLLTYASYWMHQSISRWRQDHARGVRIPVHRHADLDALELADERFRETDGRAPDPAEIDRALEWPEGKTRKLLFVLRNQMNMDMLNHSVGDHEESAFYRGAFDLLADRDLRATTSRILTSLAPREERVLRLRFGIGLPDELTLEAAGQLFDVTRERIRQIEAKALRKLKHPSRSRILRSYVGD